MICKNKKCRKEFDLKCKTSNQAYCCRDCSPYGNWPRDPQGTPEKSYKMGTDDDYEDETPLMRRSIYE